ncbi:MAG TPA: CvpA family protein [Chitinophagaceae bacterium]|nr:CvpA family protein [Chitinophagaceae bacterium]
MLIDIIFIVLLVTAIVKGYSKGLIIAVFSLLALIIGLAAAIKLSLVTANWLKDAIHVAAKWLPVIAFAIVFIIVVLAVRLGARALEKTAELVLLGWLNKLGGIILYIVLYTLIFSVLLFYAEKVNLITPATIASSKTYEFIKPWGPKVMDGIGAIVPVFKDMFHQLEDFFAGISDKMQH